MKNIVKKEDATPRQFLGVDFVVLAIGRDTMVAKMLTNQQILFLFTNTLTNKVDM